MTHKLLVFLFSLVTLAASGCGNYGFKSDPLGTNRSIAFTYIQDPSTNLYTGFLGYSKIVDCSFKYRDSLRAIRSKDCDAILWPPGAGTKNRAWRGALLYAVNLIPGEVELNAIQAYNKNYAQQIDSLRPSAKVSTPNAYFMGAHETFHIAYSSGGRILRTLTCTKPLDTPTEADLLEELAKQATGTPWEDVVRRRIVEFKQQK